MTEFDVTKSTVGDMTNTKTSEFTVDKESIDGVQDVKETTWMNENWTQYLGYYNTIPELAAVYDAGADWTVGKGFKADTDTTFILDRIKGNGFDTFNTLLENAERTMDIGGDAYLHIIRDSDGELINLKPLDPESMRHHANRQGVLIRFEQVNKLSGKMIKKFSPEEIFYLPRNRVADEIHGNTMTTRLAFIILAKNEAMADQKIMFHRFVKPRWIIKLDTDVQTEIDTEKLKWDKANDKGENMYIPMGSVEVEQMSISPNSTLNPQTMIDSLDDKFYLSAKVPKIIVGGSGGFTDAAVKTAYLAFEQNIRARQLYLTSQVGIQLGMEIKLEFPASLEAGLLSGQAKDGNQSQQLNKPSELPPKGQ